MRRILVAGASGCGKSTLAKELARRLQITFVETDPLYWEKNWNPANTQVVVKCVVEIIAREDWVLDGNFTSERATVWSKADTLIWLDYPRWLVLQRVTSRNVLWLITQEEVWSGNRMTLDHAWSGIKHSMKSYSEKSINYPRYFAEFPSLNVIRLRSPQETTRWLSSLKNSETSVEAQAIE
jgi:adenylate kinase family enzyme